MKVTLLLALFFFSGASGLAFQMAWSRMWAAGLGHEMPAVLAVIAAIFGGMAAGSWGCDRWVRMSPRPGRWYAALECGIGLWGLASTRLIPLGNDAGLMLIGLEPSALRHWSVAFILPLLVLLPATAAMGATFPVMERFVAPLIRSGRSIGGLYAANTLGAVLGVVVATYWLLPALGFTKAVGVFSAINLLCGAVAWGLEPRLPKSTPSPTQGTQSPGPFGLRSVLVLTGLLGIGFEVLGVRVLAQVLENTIYTYASVLAVYLLGTAAGAALYQMAGRRLTSPSLLHWLVMGLSTACLLGVWALSGTPILHRFLEARLGHGLVRTGVAEFGVAGAVFLLPTLLMGAAFSHLVQSARANGLGVGRAVALNTIGSALAPLAFGVVLLPWLGAKWSLVLLGLGYLALWPLISTGPTAPHGRRNHVSPWLLAVPLLLTFALPGQLRFVDLGARDKLLSYVDGVMDSVAVVEHVDGNRTLLANNRFAMGGTGAAVAERRHADLPLLLHPAPKRALFLGLGTGISFAAAGADGQLHADGVELVPEIVRAFPWFAPHNNLPQPPGRLQVHVADARRFVRAGSGKYDVIVADLFHPTRDGSGPLYAREHFEAVRQRLAGGGLFCQWLPLFQLDEGMLRVIVRTFHDVFPDTRAYLLRFNVDTPVLGLVGSLEPFRYSPDYFETRTRDPVFREHLSADQLRDRFQLFGCFLAGSRALAGFSQGAPLNTDDHPVVLFGAPRFNRQGDAAPYARLLHLLKSCSSDPSELFPSDSDSAQLIAKQLADYIAARNVYLGGLAAEAEGTTERAIDAYLESARLSAQFAPSYALCLTIAMQQAKTNPQAARRLLERLAEAQPSRPVAAQLLRKLSEQPPLPDRQAQ